MEKTVQRKFQEITIAYQQLDGKYRSLSMKHKKLLNDYETLQNEMEERIEEKVNAIIDDVVIKIEKKLEAKYSAQISKLQKENDSLKKLLSNNSNNSGIPTSKTAIKDEKRIPNSRVKSNKSIGAQHGHSKNKLDKFNEEEITETIIHEPNECTCGSKELVLIKTIDKDVLDYKIVISKTRNKYNVYKCSKCNHINSIVIPDSLRAECSYGENVKSLILLMLNDTNAPYNKIRKLITGISNEEINISEGYIAKLQTKASLSLDKFIADLKREIIKQKILHWDDTVIMVDKKKSCFRFYGNEKYALYTAHDKKDKKGMDDDNIFINLSEDTNLIHDHLTSNYNSDYIFNNCECNAHLIRDLVKVYEEYNHDWSQKMIEKITYANNNTLEISAKFDDFYNELNNLIIEGQSHYENNDYMKGNSEQTLLKRLSKYLDNYLMFLKDLDIPFTNNLAERSLRMCKSKMKVSGQFKNINYAKYYANVRSYIETCYRFNINPYLALNKLQNDEPYTIKELIKSM